MTQAIHYSVKSFLEQHNLDGNKLLIACSGGVDSMVLLHLLLKLDYKPRVAHVNFNLRADEANKDEAFVREYCRDHDLVFFQKSVDTKAYAKQNGISIQMAARDLRYAFFHEILKAEKIGPLATAHHADDSLESILINLGRGTGVLGLTGIKVKSTGLIRPLSRFSKQQIIDYAKSQSLSWREDASNQSDSYQRNNLRLNIIPKLKSAFPSFESSFSKSLKHLQEDRLLFEELIKQKLAEIVQKEESQEKIEIKKLKESSSAEALLRHWLQPYGLFDLDSILQSLDQQSGATFSIGDYTILKDRKHLLLKKHIKDENEYLIESDNEGISVPLSLLFGTCSIDTFELSKNSTDAALDFDLLQFPLKLRKWKPGDRFTPFGMKGSKKLSDYFIDRKYTKFQKEDAWLLCSGDDIVWILNDRIDDSFRLSYKTKTVYFVRLK